MGHLHIPVTSLLLWGVLSAPSVSAESPSELYAAFGSCDITPELADDRPVWLAGYGPGRRATGVHDPLFARCVVLRHGVRKLALVSVDLVGLQYPAVKRIRGRLPDYAYVLVSSTHNHEGPDVIGIWGKSLLHRGVDDGYLDATIERIAEMVRATERVLAPVSVAYGTACDESLLGDSRKPVVKDGVLRALRFAHPATGKAVGVLLQWNCHPEALGDRNTLITADFPAATVAALQDRHRCPVVYFSGALGGLMAPPAERILDEEGRFLATGDFAFARGYGLAVADLADQALDVARPIALTPLVISAATILVPVENVWYRTARVVGVLRREGRVWTGDFERPGEPLNANNADQMNGVETEVAYLRLGELHVACIPGEIYPELVYGRIEDPAVPGADYPDAPCEPSVVATLPGERWLLLGMANDEIGYILPRRQWDSQPPFAYGRSTSQYGEINSSGPLAGPIIMQALQNRVRDAGRSDGR